jgi:2-polyprenyl-3-methyl-5-hydroxy-6-metoxy-1,4-benzoquinol methylase
VHTELLRSILKDNAVNTILDAGCGPASFLRDVIKENWNLYGFDLTPEMVNEGKRIFSENNIDPGQIWQGSIIDKSSFKKPEGNTPEFDAVVCGGVLPHIPQEHDRTVVENLRDAVRTGGIVALEARNQLFGMFTLNRYSYDLFLKELIKPEIIKGRLKENGEKIDQVVEQMKERFRMDIPAIRKGKAGEPGYDEVLSRTHNPFVLKQQFEDAGLKNVKTLFYHYHCVPPMFASLLEDDFIPQSIEMENPADWRGHFMASAFYMIGTKA